MSKNQHWPSEAMGVYDPQVPTDKWKPYHVEVASGGSCRIYAPSREWLLKEIVHADEGFHKSTFLPIPIMNNSGRIVRVDIRPSQLVMVGEELPDPGSSLPRGPMVIPHEALDLLAEGPRQ